MSGCAIIAAARPGHRRGSLINKQILEIENKPIIVYTLEKFSQCDLIDSIINLVPEDWYFYVAKNIVIEKPQMSSFLNQMRKNIAKSLNIEVDQVSVKATPSDGLGFVGTGQGIAAYAICLLEIG